VLTKNHGLSQSNQTFHQIAGGSDENVAQKAKARRAAIKAEKAIPLDDDKPGSDDMSEFNS
jgi:hypothetical protein